MLPRESNTGSMRPQEDSRLILANTACDEEQPYLLFGDNSIGNQERFNPLGRLFSLKILDTRYCTGSFDVEKHTRKPCPDNAKLAFDSKEIMCPLCRETTGFNPAFYNTPSISPQQRKYNARPHYVYFAYFAPNYIKVGISSEERGYRRLLEQGARAALILGHFDNAYEARELEKRLCDTDGIYETMRSSRKTELLADYRYTFDEASDELVSTAHRCGLSAQEPCLDLNSTYFVKGAVLPNDCKVVQEEKAFGGVCIGMVGSVLVFEQDSVGYLVSLKEWVSHGIELYEDELNQPFTFEPVQMSLL